LSQAPNEINDDQLLKQFLALFSQRFGSSLRKLDSPQWRSMSQYHFLSDEELTASFSSESQILRACEPDAKARFLVITCPEEPAVVSACLSSLKKIMPVGQSLKAYRQAGASSVQIYLSFVGQVSVDAFRTKLVSLFGDSECTVHGINEPYVLPLQTGFAWLNDDLTVAVEREQLSLVQAIRKFTADLEATAIEPDALDKLTSPVVAESIASPEVEKSVLSVVDIEHAEVTSSVEEPEITLDDSEVVEQVLPTEAEALPSFPVDGGHQLLLFGISQEVARSELPKVIPRRGKRGGQDAALTETSDEGDGLKLFSVIETVAGSAGKTKRRSVTPST
jgi:hypothetical protein